MRPEKNNTIHHLHDKGYKELYSNKEVFLDLLNNILHLEWAKDIALDDLTLVDKSYVTSDYSELESDLVYQMRLGDTDAIIYVLMELQSRVDYRMPVRLLFYMTEILREYMKEANFSASNSGIRIPAILPVVLYNGTKEWDGSLTLSGITNDSPRLGDGLLDLRYSLIDVNHDYTEEELLANDCISSIILLLDQNADMEALLKRLREIVERFRSLSEGKNRQIIANWLGRTANPLLAANAVNIINAGEEEAKTMLDNMALAYERSIKFAEKRGMEQGMEQGMEKGVEKRNREMIANLYKMGMDIDFIVKASNLPKHKVIEYLN